MIHDLKTWPEYFERVKTGGKRVELRPDDRKFQVGDLLRLQEYEPGRPGWEGYYRGAEYVVRVTDIVRSSQLGVQYGWCAMSIRPLNILERFGLWLEAVLDGVQL